MTSKVQMVLMVQKALKVRKDLQAMMVLMAKMVPLVQKALKGRKDLQAMMVQMEPQF